MSQVAVESRSSSESTAPIREGDAIRTIELNTGAAAGFGDIGFVVPRVAAGRMLTVPKPCPREVRDDVVAVSPKGESTLKQTAHDFGISVLCLANWLSKADVEDDVRICVTAADA